MNDEEKKLDELAHQVNKLADELRKMRKDVGHLMEFGFLRPDSGELAFLEKRRQYELEMLELRREELELARATGKQGWNGWVKENILNLITAVLILITAGLIAILLAGIGSIKTDLATLAQNQLDIARLVERVDERSTEQGNTITRVESKIDDLLLGLANVSAVEEQP